MLFDKFKKIPYNGKEMVDITNSFLLKYATIPNSTLYTFYTVGEGDSPQSIAKDTYGDARFFFIVLLLNDIVDPFFDFPLSYKEIRSLSESKYGIQGMNKIKYLTNTTTRKQVDPYNMSLFIQDGIVTTTLPLNYSPVTFFEDELKRNDNKRNIKLLNPKHLQSFINQIEDNFKDK